MNPTLVARAAGSLLMAGLGMLVMSPAGAQAPRFSANGPDAAAYGADRGYPVAAIDGQRFYVGIFSHYDTLWESRRVPRAERPSPLGRAPAEPPLRWTLDRGEFTLDEYLSRHPVTGLLLARADAAGDGATILAERYQYARRDSHRLSSFSMAKTITAMLLGIAVAEGHIRSIDDLAEAYEPALANHPYGRSSLRHLLQMSSGVRFSERYTGDDDAAQLWRRTVAQQGPGGVAAVLPFAERTRQPGAVFAYSSAETQVLGLVLARATGRPLADYLADRLWRPMGAEADASWITDAAGQEAAYCCFNAVLRDYARLALLLAREGRQGGRQLIPAAWVREATSLADDRPDLDQVWAEAGLGYGYQTWLLPAPAMAAAAARRGFALVGLYGQVILVDPQTRLVLVHTAVRRIDRPGEAGREWRELLALWNAAVLWARQAGPAGVPAR